MPSSLLRKYADLDDVQLDGMIAYAHRTFSFLESSSPEGLRLLCDLILTANFLFDKKPTPVRSAFEFLRKIAFTDVQGAPTDAVRFAERDFVFAIKMLGLKIRNKNGVNQFVPDNRLAPDDEEVLIDTSKDARELEFYLSDVYRKRTKIQTHTIQSATNKLLREWREVELAKVFAAKINTEGMSIGQAREYLRSTCGVKDHEFVRIRQHAINLGVFQSKRNPARVNRRVTLDEDNLPFVETLAKNFAKGKSPLSISQTVNKALRDFKKLIGGAEEAPGKAKTNGKPSAR